MHVLRRLVTVFRQTLHTWLAQYEAEGLEGLVGVEMELWLMVLVGGFLLCEGSGAKALTGIDDHSWFCLNARLMRREWTPAGV